MCSLINSENQQARTEGKTKGKVKDPGPKSPMMTLDTSTENSETPTTKKGWNGSIKGTKTEEVNASDGTQQEEINKTKLKTKRDTAKNSVGK